MRIGRPTHGVSLLVCCVLAMTISACDGAPASPPAAGHSAASTPSASTPSALGPAQPEPAVGAPAARSPSSPAADASPTPGPLPVYRSIPELSSALAAQMYADRTALFTDDATVNAQPSIHLVGEGGLRIDGTGFWAQTHQFFNTPGTSVADLWVVLVPGFGFLRTPPDLSGLPPSRPWVEVRQGGVDGATVQYGPLVDAVHQAIDPTQLLTGYGDALALVRADPDQLDNTPVVRYQVRLDVARGQLTSPQAGVKNLLGEVLAGGSRTMDFQLWLDEHNRLLQMTATVPVPSASTTVTTTVNYSAWAEPLNITVPSPPQVSAGH
jgi:hypothetical protein